MCGARLQVVLAFTGYFGLGTGKAVALKVEDINVQGDVPKISVGGEVRGAKKDVYIRKQHIGWVKKLMKDGLAVSQTKRHKHGKGRLKKVTFENKYTVPKTGWMFPSRQKSKTPHLCYHAVYTQVKRCAPLFLQSLQRHGKKHSPDVARLRPHSGLVLQLSFARQAVSALVC